MKVIIAIFAVVINNNVLSAQHTEDYGSLDENYDVMSNCNVSASSHCKDVIGKPRFPFKKEWIEDYYLFFVKVLKCQQLHALTCFQDSSKATTFDTLISTMRDGYEAHKGVKSGSPVSSRDCRRSSSADCAGFGGHHLPYPYENEWKDDYYDQFMGNLNCKIDYALFCDADISRAIRLDRWMQLAKRVYLNETYIVRDAKAVNCENEASLDCEGVGREEPHGYTLTWLDTYCEPFIETVKCVRDLVLNRDTDKSTLPVLMQWMALANDFCDKESVQRKSLENAKSCGADPSVSPDCGSLFGEELPPPYTSDWLNKYCGPFIAQAKCMRNQMLDSTSQEHTALVLDKWIDFAEHLCNLKSNTLGDNTEVSTNCSILASFVCSETVKEQPYIKVPELVDYYCEWPFIKNLRCKRDRAISCEQYTEERIDVMEKINRREKEELNFSQFYENPPINCRSFAAPACLHIGGLLPYPDTPDWSNDYCVAFTNNLRCKKDHMLHCELDSDAAADLDRWIEFTRRVCYDEIFIRTDPVYPSNCSTTYFYCSHFDDIIPRPNSPEWLNVFCEHTIYTFKCKRAHDLACDYGIPSATIYDRWITYGEELCDESSSIHKDIEKHYSCFQEIEKSGQCNNISLNDEQILKVVEDLSDYGLRTTYARENLNIVKECVSILIESVCYIVALEEECGTKARDAYEYIFKNLLPYEPCDERLRHEVPMLIYVLKNVTQPINQDY